MAFDPLHKPKTLQDRRKYVQAACRSMPCQKVQAGKEPPCVVCVHEGLYSKPEIRLKERLVMIREKMK